MAEQLALSFAGLLRQLRDEAGLTQEELAKKAAARVVPRQLPAGVGFFAGREAG